MVETAPLPAGFDPIDAATLPPAPVEAAGSSAPQLEVASSAPVRTPHPLEAWAEPGPLVEPVIRRVLPGGGYLNATATALRKLEEGEALIRRMAGPGIRHASEIAAERRQREDEDEAARRARGDPRAVLRAAIVLQAEAQAEVDRLTPLVLRARELVEGLTERQSEARVAITDQQTVAAAKLTEALAAGVGREALPTAPQTDSLEAAAAALAGRLRIAADALRHLEAEIAAADDLLTRRRHGVARCALNVLVDQAADLANEILDAAAELDERRASLDSLAMLLTAENRRLNARPLPLPAQVTRALHPSVNIARPPAIADWQAAYVALIAGEEDGDPHPSA
jgi:hypothetical protein